MTQTLTPVIVTPRIATYLRAHYSTGSGKHNLRRIAICEVASRNVSEFKWEEFPHPDIDHYWDLITLHIFDQIEATLEDGTILKGPPHNEVAIQITVDGEHIRHSAESEYNAFFHGWHRASKLKEGPFLIIPKNFFPRHLEEFKKAS